MWLRCSLIACSESRTKFDPMTACAAPCNTVKRHLVCKRWTIEKADENEEADENSNGTPCSALHRPNSDKLRFPLPSLPWRLVRRLNSLLSRSIGLVVRNTVQ